MLKIRENYIATNNLNITNVTFLKVFIFTPHLENINLVHLNIIIVPRMAKYDVISYKFPL